MTTINGVRLDVSTRSSSGVNGGMGARINANMPYGYDYWRMTWNGNHFAPPPAGAVLYLPGDPGQGATIKDFSGSANNGTIYGPVWTRLPSGLPSLLYDGTDDYTEVADHASLNFGLGSFTMMAWVNGTAAKYIISKQNCVNDILAGYIMRNVAGSTLQVGLYDGDERILGSDGDALNVSQWYHVAGVCDRTAVLLKRYVNGITYGTDTSIATLGNTSNAVNLQIGRRFQEGGGGSTGNWWPGYIKLVTICSAALSAGQIVSYYAQTRHLFGV